MIERIWFPSHLVRLYAYWTLRHIQCSCALPSYMIGIFGCYWSLSLSRFLMNRNPNRNRLVRVISERMFHSSSISRNGSVFYFTLSFSPFLSPVRSAICVVNATIQPFPYARTHSRTAHTYSVVHPPLKNIYNIVDFGFSPDMFIVNIDYILQPNRALSHENTHKRPSQPVHMVYLLDTNLCIVAVCVSTWNGI